MKCRVGDRVRFLNDVGGGKITRIIDSRTISVLNEDGFEIPVLESEVIVIDSHSDKSIESFKLESESDTFEEKSKNKITLQHGGLNEKESLSNSSNHEITLNISGIGEEKDPEGEILGLLIAFVPKDQMNMVDSDQELYIINDSPYRVLYSLGKWNQNLIQPIAAGILLPDSKEFLTTFPKKELNNPLGLNIQAIFLKNVPYTAQQPEFFDVELNPVKFYRQGSFTENDFFEENAFILTVVDTQKQEVMKTLTTEAIEESIVQKDIKSKPLEQKKEPELMEVDLHIHELVENYSGMQPSEILNVQLARFITALETGLRSKTTRKMVFIHGLGNGKLKNEVIRKLQKDYPKLRYQDASFKEYGFGATMVFVK